MTSTPLLATQKTPMETFYPLNAQAVIGDLYDATWAVLKKHGVVMAELEGPIGTSDQQDNLACLYGAMEEVVIYAARVAKPKTKAHQHETIEVVGTLEELSKRAGL